MSLKTNISIASATAVSLIAMALAGTAMPGMAAPAKKAMAGVLATSPALCGVGDIKEPGIQGDVPADVKVGSYNCGVRLVGELPLVGNVAGVGKCAYVRTRGTGGQVVHVIDVSNP